MIDNIRESVNPGEPPDSEYTRSVSISRGKETVVVMFLGPRLDQRTAPSFLGAVSQVLDRWPEMGLVLDLGRVLDMDNDGLTAIIRIFKRILSNQRSLLICGVNARLQELFRITMLDQTLGTHYQPGQSLH
jgi:anti-anti-sigma factor